jgi:glc operon protein GlcG
MELRTTRALTYGAAAQLVADGVAEAGEHRTPLSIAVVDPQGTLLAFARMDGAPAFSARLAIAKAMTAATFGRPTADMESLIADRPGFAVGFLSQGGWFIARGGAPIIVDRETVGAVGVSGNTAEVEDGLARRLAAGGAS